MIIFIHKVDTNTPEIIDKWFSEVLEEDKSAAQKVANKLKMP